MKIKRVATVILLGLSLAAFLASTVFATAAQHLFLPLIYKSDLPPTQIPTLVPTLIPTGSPATTGNVTITTIFFSGSGSSEPDEYVEIKNSDSQAIQLRGWTLRDNAAHIYTFPSYLINPEETCRIYTNQSHPDTCGFNYRNGSAIWNNTGDCAILRDAQNKEINKKCY